MKLVVIESPYGDSNPTRRASNRVYAREAMRDSIARGECPIASHLIYTQPGILNDEDEVERALGIECGYAWGEHAIHVAFYIDRGCSRGMLAAQDHWRARGKRIVYRAFAPVQGVENIEVGRWQRCGECSRTGLVVEGACHTCRAIKEQTAP